MKLVMMIEMKVVMEVINHHLHHNLCHQHHDHLQQQLLHLKKKRLIQVCNINIMTNPVTKHSQMLQTATPVTNPKEPINIRQTPI